MPGKRINWDDDFIVSNDLGEKTLKEAHDIYCKYHNNVSIYSFRNHCKDKLRLKFLFANRVCWNDEFIKQKFASCISLKQVYNEYISRFGFTSYENFRYHVTHKKELKELKERQDQKSKCFTDYEISFLTQNYKNMSAVELKKEFEKKFSKNISISSLYNFERKYICVGTNKNLNHFGIYLCGNTISYMNPKTAKTVSLARTLYEIYNNCELKENEIICVKDGNTFNFAKDNLIKFTSRSSASNFMQMNNECGYVPEVADALVGIAELKGEIRKIKKEGEQ